MQTKYRVIHSASVFYVAELNTKIGSVLLCMFYIEPRCHSFEHPTDRVLVVDGVESLGAHALFQLVDFTQIRLGGLCWFHS